MIVIKIKTIRFENNETIQKVSKNRNTKFHGSKHERVFKKIYKITQTVF